MARVTLIVPFDPALSSNPSSVPQPPLRLAYLASAVRAEGHNTTVIDGVGEGFGKYWTYKKRFFLHGLTIQQLVQKIPEDSDVIGISMQFSRIYPPVKELVRRIRDKMPDAFIVMGGEGVSGIPDWIIKEIPIDAVIVGQGEPPLIELLSALDAGNPTANIPNVVTELHKYSDVKDQKFKGCFNSLDDIPFPAWDLIPLKKYWDIAKIYGVTQHPNYIPIAASRGCPYRCKYCTSSTTWGLQRYRSAENVIEEMKYFKEKYDVKHFTFNDLNLTRNMKWFDDFIEKLLSSFHGEITWGAPTGVHAQSIGYKTFKRAKESGLIHLQIAPDTGSERILKYWKNNCMTFEGVEETIINAKAAGLPICCFIMVGFPDETMDEFIETLKFLSHIAKLGVDEIAVAIFVPLPGSSSFSQLLEEGKIELNDSFFLALAQGDISLKKSYSEHFNGRELQALRLHLYLWFYSHVYMQKPSEPFNILVRILSNKQKTKLDKVIRYEFIHLLKVFAHVLTPSSFAVLTATALRWFSNESK